MEFKIPNEPFVVVVAGTELSFVRDSENGYIIATGPNGSEKLSLPLYNLFIGGLQAVKGPIELAIRSDALKNQPSS